MIKPTVGRVVLIFNRLSGRDQPEPALVTYVWSDRMINVGGFDSNGMPFAMTSTTLVQDGDHIPSYGHAQWMPYQKAVAAGTAAPTLHADAPQA